MDQAHTLRVLMAEHQSQRPLLWLADFSAGSEDARARNAIGLARGWTERGLSLRLVGGVKASAARHQIERVDAGIVVADRVLWEAPLGLRHELDRIACMGALDSVVVVVGEREESLIEAERWARRVRDDAGVTRFSVGVNALTDLNQAKMRLEQVTMASKYFYEFEVRACGVFSSHVLDFQLDSKEETASVQALKQFAKRIDEVTGDRLSNSSGAGVGELNLSRSEERTQVQMPGNQTMFWMTSIGEVENESQSGN